MAELSEVPVAELLAAAMARPEEMINESGFLSSEAFLLRNLLGIRVCVDGAAARRNAFNEVELMAIRRNTGPYAGKLCLVGGEVISVKDEGGERLAESFEEALARHFKKDTGYEIKSLMPWHSPYVVQEMAPHYGRVKSGFSPNQEARHLVANRFLVAITNPDNQPSFGSTEHGGQEANEIVWFNSLDMPDPAAFGYGHAETYEKMFVIAESVNLSRILGN
jgi:hypothetical protein